MKTKNLSDDMVVCPSLTKREKEILCLVQTGKTNKEIASEEIISEATVETHLSNINKKLGARTRIQAINLAKESGLIE